MCGRYPGSRWLLGRSELKALKRTTLVTFFQVAKSMGMLAGVHYYYNAASEVIRFATGGSEIMLYDLGWIPSDPNYDRLGSLELTGAAIDEIGQITYRCFETVRSRCRYKLLEFGLIPKIMGSCNPVKGWPYTEFYKPWKENRLSAHRQFVQALPTDNPFLPESYINSLRTMKDKLQKERLLFGNWEYDDDPSALFSYDAITDIFTNKYVEESDERYLIGDVSRQGRDRMVLGLFEGMHCYRVIELPYEIRSSTSRSAEFIKTLAAAENIRTSRIILDEDGVGGGVVDQIPGCKGFVNNSSQVLTDEEKELEKSMGRIVNYANLKSQCYHLLSIEVEKGNFRITCDTETEQLITEELEQIKRSNVDRDGKFAVIGKDHIKEAIGRSPDFADMLMMRMRFFLPFPSNAPAPVMPMLMGIQRK